MVGKQEGNGLGRKLAATETSSATRHLHGPWSSLARASDSINGQHTRWTKASNSEVTLCWDNQTSKSSLWLGVRVTGRGGACNRRSGKMRRNIKRVERVRASQSPQGLALRPPPPCQSPETETLLRSAPQPVPSPLLHGILSHFEPARPPPDDCGGEITAPPRGAELRHPDHDSPSPSVARWPSMPSALLILPF